MSTKINNYGDVLLSFEDWDKLNKLFLTLNINIWKYFSGSNSSKPINKMTLVSVINQDVYTIMDLMNINYEVN